MSNKKIVEQFDITLNFRLAATTGDDFEGLIKTAWIALFGAPGGLTRLQQGGVVNYATGDFKIHRVDAEQLKEEAEERARRERRALREAKSAALESAPARKAKVRSNAS